MTFKVPFNPNHPATRAKNPQGGPCPAPGDSSQGKGQFWSSHGLQGHQAGPRLCEEQSCTSPVLREEPLLHKPSLRKKGGENSHTNHNRRQKQSL